jgi:polyvinyl alcohol dehydrogenase (cytochrome)
MKKIRHSLSVPTLILGVVLAALAVTPLMAQDWPVFGQNLANTATNQSSISTRNVGSLQPKWVFTTGGEVSARPAVVGNMIYFPDWAGNLYALKAGTGQVKWSHQFSDYGLAAGTVSRSTPTVAGNTLYIGTQYNPSAPAGTTGWLLAIHADDGHLIWMTQPDSNASPVITASPVVDGNTVYVGMTSNEESAAGNPSYPCCSIRGSVVALDANTGAKRWQTYMAPIGYSGANIWGSNPVIDERRHTLYVSTGDNYSHPTASAPSSIPGETFSQCLADPNGGSEAACLATNDYVDSIIAMDMRTGTVKWSVRMVNWNQPYEPTNGSDDFNVACIPPYPPANCPSNPTGPDYDFGSAVNEITYWSGHGFKTIIGAGQKSGIYYALDPDTGATLWQTQVGPGSALGGMEWGSASDGTRIYVAISNYYGIPWTGGHAGGWAALDPATGNILWTTADPNGSVDLGPLAVANGVLYAPSMAGGATQTNMYALNASTGSILWSYASGGSVIAGATPVGDDVYWGSGYTHLPIPGFTTNNKFYDFSRNGR